MSAVIVSQSDTGLKWKPFSGGGGRCSPVFLSVLAAHIRLKYFLHN